jgi:hypothetical protein
MSKMSYKKLGIAFALACVLLMTTAIPVLAQSYDPGVSAGQTIEYGNFTAPEAEDVVESLKVEVLSVSGKEVTLRETQTQRDGSEASIDIVFNVETGSSDREVTYYPDLIIAANLGDGDEIPPLDSANLATIDSVETRTYLGESRVVNIVTATETGEGYTTTSTHVYDKVSGIRLETETELTMGTTTSTYSHSITSTNIFDEPEPTPSEGIPDEYIYVAVAAVVIVVIAIAVVLVKRK